MIVKGYDDKGNPIWISSLAKEQKAKTVMLEKIEKPKVKLKIIKELKNKK